MLLRRVIASVSLIVFLLAPSLARASLSVVADLDGTIDNGPDTLVIEPTDTFTVAIWITGSDSLHALGLTIGDSAGAFVWIPEDTSLYATPGTWTDQEVVPNNDSTWFLLQSTDFSVSEPIHANVKIANVKFTITAGESCGTLMGNLSQNMSGWYNSVLGDTLFVGYQGITVCVEEVLDGEGGNGEGSGEGSTEGGSEEAGSLSDDSSSDDPSGQDSFPTSFTRTYNVTDEDYLFVHGYRLKGLVTFRWSDNSPLYVDDYQVWPKPNDKSREEEIEQLSARYGGYAYVDSLIELGIDWESAVSAFKKRRMVIVGTVKSAYLSSWRETASVSLARRAAENARLEFSGSMLIAGNQLRWQDGYLFFPWNGPQDKIGYYEQYIIHATSMGNSKVPLFPTYPQASRWVDKIVNSMDSPGPAVVVIPTRGRIRTFSFGGPPSPEFYEKYLSQIEDSTPDEILAGPLSKAAVREILDRGGVMQ